MKVKLCLEAKVVKEISCHQRLMHASLKTEPRATNTGMLSLKEKDTFKWSLMLCYAKHNCYVGKKRESAVAGYTFFLVWPSKGDRIMGHRRQVSGPLQRWSSLVLTRGEELGREEGRVNQHVQKASDGRATWIWRSRRSRQWQCWSKEKKNTGMSVKEQQEDPPHNRNTDCPGSPVVTTPRFQCRWCWLIPAQELRSHMPCVAWPKNK